ncbi:MAG TPA: hypothetical protein VHW60_20375 [Caulobacteraceae bacterium]|jgi:hypothetical protein|nr:hypothetical protein [Caulobacteraceae bacterium]
MRRLDWLMAAVIGVFLAGALIAQAMDLGGVSLNLMGRRDAGSRQDLAVRLVSIGANSPISRLCPTIFRRP